MSWSIAVEKNLKRNFDQLTINQAKGRMGGKKGEREKEGERKEEGRRQAGMEGRGRKEGGKEIGRDGEEGKFG